MKSAEVVLTSADRAVLRSWVAGGKTEQRLALRAAVILGVAEGLSNAAVVARLGVRPATVSKWRGRFARHADDRCSPLLHRRLDFHRRRRLMNLSRSPEFPPA